MSFHLECETCLRLAREDSLASATLRRYPPHADRAAIQASKIPREKRSGFMKPDAHPSQAVPQTERPAPLIVRN